MANNFNEVGKFYDDDKIAGFWALIHERHMHTAYWEKNSMGASIAEGSKKLTDLMVEKAQIKMNENFVDIGCGFGIPAIELAKKKKCNVYGITASNYQKNEAEKNAQQEDVAHLLHFEVCDAKNTGFKNDFFDGGWFFESIFHMGHEKALQEARRILKKGAVLLLTDFLTLPSLKDADKNYLLETFHVESFKTFEEYPQILEQTGFELIELWDITNETLKIRTKKYEEALIIFKEKLIEMGGNELFQQTKSFWDATNRILGNDMGYALITCRKK